MSNEFTTLKAVSDAVCEAVYDHRIGVQDGMKILRRAIDLSRANADMIPFAELDKLDDNFRYYVFPEPNASAVTPSTSCDSV